MRILFYFLLSLFLLNSCQRNVTKNKVENYTEVNLNFKDYKPHKHKSFIDLTIENGVHPIEQQLKISDSGIVSYSFINDKKRELVFKYENREFSLIVSPNEELNAYLSVAELTDWNSTFKGFKITSGENSITNNLILRYTSYLDSLIKQAPNGFSNDGKSVDIDYKNKRMSEMQDQLNAFDLFIRENKIKDKTFIDWSRSQIRYRAGFDLSLFPFFGIMNKEIDDEKEYFNFINELNPNDNEELTYQSYLKYLETLSTSYKIISNIADKYSSKREQLKENSSSNFPILFKMIKKLPKNKEREFLMAYIYRNNNQIPEKYKDSLQFFVSDDILSQVKSLDKIETLDIITLIENYDIPDNEKAALLALYKESKGKVIYHDFWFTNCAPCMKELPNYNDLIATTNQKKVEFIFYGAYMEKDEWRATIEKLKLKGKHHLLTKNQLAFFEKYFGVHGFPHHHIINSNGKISEKVRFGTYPGNFKEINKLIEKNHIVKSKK
ncbi:TlpA disulfide reductase family protein [Zhouia amylolytica]|uniref:TlpA disulfide reductase family protein n=1 Tax=Zhouia amylolytica TaxID=376730 RepID=UPI0020CC22CB|nr:TlpA disulfide reductase family protein [Zhouia amylolytica]MCQ0113044.1 TlpA family protein disulfide reductase [Zhouia amylolytica]